MSQSLRRVGVFVVIKKDVNKNPYTVNLIKLQLCKSPWYVRRIPFPLSLSPKSMHHLTGERGQGGGHIIGLRTPNYHYLV
jgi:hypothetical protein